MGLAMTSTLAISNQASVNSLEDWLQNPPDNTEWVNDHLINKKGMGLRHSQIQSRLSRYWGNYVDAGKQGGEVYTDVPCRTNKQGRRPDVAYLSPELLTQYNNVDVLPQSFPLIAEIVSPNDEMEDVFLKVNEYLQSGCQEVWLVLPESHWIIITITQQKRTLLTVGDVVRTQVTLPNFKVEVDKLLAWGC